MSGVLVDSNVLLDVLTEDPGWFGWSSEKLAGCADAGPLAINPIIYAEISLSFSTLEGLDSAVSTLGLELREVPRPALFLAAKAFVQYRRRRGSKLQVLPDFFIGAHAAVEGWPLLTPDATRFRTYFPTLEVIAP